jgi:antitoxin VapB
MSSTSQLNIKNPEAWQLAHRLAEATGETVTEAVTVALRERFERVERHRDRAGLAERLMQIGRRVASLPDLDSREPDDILYDELGLPK